MLYDIAIVIINYNSSKYTIDCIKSILEKTSTQLSVQFVVVDNASKHDDFNILKEEIAKTTGNIKLVRSKINTGFGGGNMFGTQFTNSKFLAFVNNDTYLENDCLSILKEFMETNDHAGVCGPQAFTDSNKLLPTFDHFPSLTKIVFKRKFLEFINSEKYPKRNKLYKTPVKGQFIAGSFMFFRTEDFFNVGGFDTNIFLYHEESDICKRLLKLEKHAYLVPQGKFTHYHGASTTKGIAIKQELKLSLLYIIKKHYSFLHYITLLLYLQISYFFKSLFKPKYWSLFYTLIIGAPLSRSLKQKQPISEYND